MSYSIFDLFHTGLSLGGTTPPPTPTPFFYFRQFLFRLKKCPFPSPIHILHTHENAPSPPHFEILMTFLIKVLVNK